MYHSTENYRDTTSCITISSLLKRIPRPSNLRCGLGFSAISCLFDSILSHRGQASHAHLEPDHAQLRLNMHSNNLVSRLKPAHNTDIKGTHEPFLGRSAAMQRFQRFTPLARLRPHASLLSGQGIRYPRCHRATLHPSTRICYSNISAQSLLIKS